MIKIMKWFLFLFIPFITVGQTVSINENSSKANDCYRIDTVYVSAKVKQLKTKDVIFGIKQISEEVISEKYCLSTSGIPISIEVFYFGVPKTTLRIVGIEKSNQTTQVGIRFILPNNLKYEGIGESDTEVRTVMLELEDGIPFAKATVSNSIKKAILECISKMP